MTPLIQIAAVTGVYGVSFLVVWTSLALYSGVIALLRNPTTRYVWLGEVTAPLVVVMLIFNLGSARIRNAPAPDAAREVAFIQPAIPQTMIWDPAESTNRFRQLLALTQAALTNRTDLVLWPEAALPEFTEANFAAMVDLARTHQTWLIFGADDVRWRTNATSPEDYEVFNAAFALPPTDAPPQFYHKRQLVIFGEYVPLVDWLPFIQWFTPITGSFTPGEQPGAFDCDGLTIAPLICFEDTFPHHVRNHVTPNTDWLVNLTNDGWFGSGAAQRQHAATAAFRAVENGIPLLRSCNTGLTCWFDARGQLREVWRDESGSVYGPGFANWRIEFVSAAQRGPATYYNRHGDRFGWGCVGFSVALLLWRWQLARQNRLRPAATPAASA
jgi:apolipoprotein N-acyltransferase